MHEGHDVSHTLKAFLIVAWLTTSALHGARAAQGDPEEAKERGAKEPDVIYVSTPQHIVDVMLAMADVKKTDLLYDLGCGDGRIVVTAAKRFGCKALGVDIDSARVRESQANVKAANLENLVTIVQKDIFELDLSEADVVMLYLLPRLNVRLIPQLEKMKPGSRIVSHDFDMLGVEPDFVLTCSSREGRKDKIYLWTTPLKKTPITDAAHGITDVWPVKAIKAYVMEHVVLTIVISVSLALAALFWLLRNRLGVIKVNVRIERP